MQNNEISKYTAYFFQDRPKSFPIYSLILPFFLQIFIMTRMAAMVVIYSLYLKANNEEQAQTNAAK